MTKTLSWLTASFAFLAGFTQPALAARQSSDDSAGDLDSPASIFDLNPSFFTHKKVLVRLDLNVPTEERGGKVQMADDSRLQATLPTLRYLLDANAKVIVMSHLGDPKPEQQSQPQFSLRLVQEPLHLMLNVPVHFLASNEGDSVREAADSLREGEVLLLENSRFTPSEKANDAAYSEFLASLADVFVFDAFGTAHRKHATTVGAPQAFKKNNKPALMGLLMKREVNAIDGASKSPVHPVAWIVGGLKVSSKAALLSSLIEKSVKGDSLLLGGCMALTFLKAKGMETGASVVEDSEVETAQVSRWLAACLAAPTPRKECLGRFVAVIYRRVQRILDMAAKKGVEVLLPRDFLLSNAVSKDAPLLGVCTAEEGVPPGLVALDQGPATNEFFASRIREAKTIFWNGPMGLSENPLFAKGTAAVAEAAGSATASGATSVVGGGDSVAAVKKLQKSKELQLSHLSTGGGATLKMLEGVALPALAALTTKGELNQLL